VTVVVGLKPRSAGNQHFQADHGEAGVVEHHHLDWQMVGLHGEQPPSSMARPPSPDNKTTGRSGWDTWAPMAIGRALAIEP
jgi:hypothetical protein